nr:class I SAM-dependent methyltransferase [Rickettsia endosymbiont of Ceutorhynchus assimilis]
MNKLDTYLSLCAEVYDLRRPTPPKDAYEFYRSYIKNAEGLILEPMCGSGRFLLPLIEEGFDIQGFDASPHMLKRLCHKAEVKNLKPNVWNGFIEDLAKPERYALIFIPSGSFCLIIDQEAVKSALKIFYDHLAEDGILLFESDTINTAPTTGIWGGSKWSREDGKMIIFSTCTTLKDNICSSIGRYELIDNNKIICTEIEELKFRLYNQDELTILLHSVGFREVRAIKTFNKDRSPDEDDEIVIFECKK